LPAYGVHDGAKVVVCSPELAEMFGASSPSELVGRDVFRFITREARDQSIASISAGAIESYESTGVRVDATKFPIHIESAPIRSRDCGEARLVIIRDLSPVALVVDDEAPVVRMTAFLMRHAGYQAAAYTSSRQALADYQLGAASVIVTDVLMPEMDGVSMVEAIRKLDPSVPVLFISGYSEVPVPQDEATIFVKKPFGIVDLDGALAKLPERARARIQ